MFAGFIIFVIPVNLLVYKNKYATRLLFYSINRVTFTI